MAIHLHYVRSRFSFSADLVVYSARMSVVVVSAFVFVDRQDLVSSFSSGMGFAILQMVETEELEVLFALKLRASIGDK